MKSKHNRKNNPSNGGSSATMTQAQTQSQPQTAKKPGTLKIEDIVAEMAGKCGEVEKVVLKHEGDIRDQGARMDEFDARLSALEGKKASEKVVDAYCYYPGGDTSKPLSDPTDNFWVAIQSGAGKIVKVKARLKDGKLEALSPAEAAKYA